MDWKVAENKTLVEAVLALKTPEEVRLFLRDLMTEGEIHEFAKRLKAATMLAENIPYSQIQKTTGLSATTVARVSKWLQAEGGGYKLILARLHSHRT
jgi:TrpR-related protein YerC/YecD